MFNEASIIQSMLSHFSVRGGIGDDAAILPLSKEESYVITKDILVEDVHFRLSYFSAYDLAHKVLHVNLSDIAAMGAIPRYVFLGISIPSTPTNVSNEGIINNFFVSTLLKSFAENCKKNNVVLMGGDTTRSPGKLFISVTIVGVVQNDNIKSRYSAKNDDIVCVAGNIGYAHVGLIALENNMHGFPEFKETLLRPASPVQEGKWFGMQKAVTAMMDISDGLIVDLEKLCKSSNVTADLYLDELDEYGKSSKSYEIKGINGIEFNKACKELNLNILHTKLTGGEDYGLLVTIKHSDYERIRTEFFAEFKYQLKCVGRIINATAEGYNTVNNRVKLMKSKNHDEPLFLNVHKFSHFGEL